MHLLVFCVQDKALPLEQLRPPVRLIECGPLLQRREALFNFRPKVLMLISTYCLLLLGQGTLELGRIQQAQMQQLQDL
ncbi:hypothetical protein IQ22_04575 [Pseudomonas duriflava]|uniref:Uncharacterized protein n=1 Tax=Pseudomonas duriflava TaxID=459528 RepID=A0A562PN03_9PSED|nr:hypothetical protein IQ22_04575 [Pseudomonas duriflava]